HVAVSKLAHQLVDAYEKRLTSISVDVNKIRRDQDALFELAEEWQDLEPNLAATMHRLARHELFDDLNRLNIDIQYGGPEHVQSPSSRKVHNLRELAYRTTLLDPQGAYGQYLAEGDFAVESLNLDPWVSPQSAEPIEIDLESDFGRGLVRVLNFIGESCKATRTPTEWTAVGGRLEQQFVSPECQNRQEVWDAVGSLRELALTNSTESLVSDAFLEGFMTNKALAIWNSQPKPSPIVRRTSGMTPQPEIAAAAATSVSMPLGDQERVIGLAERSLLREVVVALLPLVDDPQNEARTETQWRELGGRVGQKFIEGPTSNNEIFQRVNRLVYFAEYGDEDPDIWGPLLDGIFSVGGVTAKYDQIDLMGSSGRSTPRSVGADAVEDTDRRDPLNSGSVSSVVSTPAASGSRSHGNSLIQPVFLAGDGDDDGPLDEGATLLGVLRYINGSNAEPTEPIDWRAVGQAFRARVDELSSLNSPVSPSANLAIIQMALDDIEHPSQATIDFLDGYADASSSTNLPSQDASFGRIYALEPGLFVSDRTASEPFFELGMNVRDALARYGRQIDGLGSRSSGIEGNDSGEHGETSERHSQLQAAVNELRSGASQSERIRSFFKGFDSDSRNSSTLESFYVGQTAGGTVRQSLFGEDDDLFGLDGEFVPGFENSINSVSPGVGRGVVASSTPFYIGGQLGGSSSSVDFEEAPGEDILPGENPGLSASAMHSRGDRESRFTPLNRVHTEGNILKGYKYTGESDAESDDKSDDSGFADALGSYAAVFRRELSVRNKQEKEMNRSSADGDNEIIVAPLDTSAAKNPSRSSLIPNFGIYDYFAGTKRATENASSDPRIASLADADLGPVSRETLEMTSPGKKPGGSPNLRAYDSQKGIELRSSSSGSGSKHSVGDPDEDL
ncbi:hypothetical protein EBR57_01955, partial [bacterium]|nr:hypothetical protein [bacterium]